MSHFLQMLVEWLGLDQQSQFIYGIMVYLAVFVVWAARSRSHGVVFSILFCVMGLALFVFLFSENATVGMVGAGVLAVSVIAAFVWHYVRCRKAARQI